MPSQRHGRTPRRGGLAACAVAVLLALAPSGRAEPVILGFADLPGWAEDEPAEALAAFRHSCPALSDPEFRSLCAVAAQDPDARWFFETFFRPLWLDPDSPARFTGYFEPELPAARRPGGAYRFPLYRPPPGLQPGDPWLTRAGIDAGALAGRGLEIAWLRDPVDKYFLQVQGSGRLRLPDGSLVRLGFAAQNGHPRRSVAQALIDRGVLPAHAASVAAIRGWVRANPGAGQAALADDPSYVFFRELPRHDPALGPLGALNRPLTPGRSVAVDPAHVPLGAPVWVEVDGALGWRRLMVAQDTGGAIRGAQRADLFIGTGTEAGDLAGLVRDGGRMVVLLPIERAFVVALGD